LVVAVGVLVGAAFLLAKLQGGGSHGRAATQNSSADTRPPPSKEERAKPIGVPAPVPAGTGRFEILRHQPDSPTVPVAFDPCRPIHYVVNPAGAPADGSALIADAIARVHTATGLQFVFDGTTTETPDKERASYQPGRYGRVWAPVLVAWSDETTYPELAGYIAGLGGAEAVDAGNGRLVYVTGQVVLDDQQLSVVATRDRGVVRAILLHELGHLVGLDHTSDRGQLMFSESDFSVRDYGDGDLRGLDLLGTQACFPKV
jgi:hypothetical protein